MVKKKKEKEPKLEVNETNAENLTNEDMSKKENNNLNKPSEEEIKQAKEEFDKGANDFSTKTWQIGAPEKSKEIIDYIKHFIEKRLFWTKNGWLGVVKLTEELNEAEKITNVTEGGLKLGYQAIEFLYYSLSNPAGIGLQTAKDFEAEYELFADIFKAVETCLEDARKQLEEVQFLQEKWATMSQGYYIEREDGTKEAEIEKLKKEQEEQTKKEEKHKEMEERKNNIKNKLKNKK